MVINVHDTHGIYYYGIIIIIKNESLYFIV